MSSQPQWNYNNNYGAASNVSSAGPSANPLFGISMDSYDLTGTDYSVMPPPGFGLSPPTATNPAGNGGPGDEGYDPYNTFGAFGTDTQDWYTLPLDNLINMPAGAEVEQRMYGPQIGGQDMLEMLLGDPNMQLNGNGYS